MASSGVEEKRGWERKPMVMRSTWIAMAIGSALFAGATAGSAADHKYVGLQDCAKCHKKELLGDQYAEWQKNPHSQAYKTLTEEKAAELAKKIAKPISDMRGQAWQRVHLTGVLTRRTLRDALERARKD